jgi:hypothetical protein
MSASTTSAASAASTAPAASAASAASAAPAAVAIQQPSSSRKRSSTRAATEDTHPRHALPFILFNPASQAYELQEETVRQLTAQPKRQPVRAYAVMGEARTGKSTLMNLLSNSASAFAVGHSTDTCTQGIYIVQTEDGFLLDVEGTGGTRVSAAHDAKLMLLACTMASTVILNIKSHLGSDTLLKLGSIAQMVSMIEDFDTAHTPPMLLVVLRDFTLQLPSGTTPDQYLEQALYAPLREECGASDTDHALRASTSSLIAKLFPQRSCFTFPVPTSRLPLHPGDPLTAEFSSAFRHFANHLHRTLRPLTGLENTPLTMEPWILLVRQILQAVNGQGLFRFQSVLEQLQEAQFRSVHTNLLQQTESSIERKRVAIQEQRDELPDDPSAWVLNSLRKLFDSVWPRLPPAYKHACESAEQLLALLEQNDSALTDSPILSLHRECRAKLNDAMHTLAEAKASSLQAFVASWSTTVPPPSTEEELHELSETLVREFPGRKQGLADIVGLCAQWTSSAIKLRKGAEDGRRLLMTELESLRADVTSTSALRAQLIQARSDVTDTQAALHRLTEETAARNQQRAAADAEEETQRATHHALVQQLRQNVLDATRHKEQLQTDLQQQEKKVRDLHANIHTLQQTLSNTQQALGQSQTSLAATQTQLQTTKQRHQDTLTALNDLERQHATVSVLSDRRQREVEALTAEKEQLVERIRLLTEREQKVQTDLSMLRVTYEGLERQVRRHALDNQRS